MRIIFLLIDLAKCAPQVNLLREQRIFIQIYACTESHTISLWRKASKKVQKNGHDYWWTVSVVLRSIIDITTRRIRRRFLAKMIFWMALIGFKTQFSNFTTLKKCLKIQEMILVKKWLRSGKKQDSKYL